MIAIKHNVDQKYHSSEYQKTKDEKWFEQLINGANGYDDTYHDQEQYDP